HWRGIWWGWGRDRTAGRGGIATNVGAHRRRGSTSAACVIARRPLPRATRIGALGISPSWDPVVHHGMCRRSGPATT
ncbi:hypothetical protein FOZ62_019854, partial [Perkinsus olseni]